MKKYLQQFASPKWAMNLTETDFNIFIRLLNYRKGLVSKKYFQEHKDQIDDLEQIGKERKPRVRKKTPSERIKHKKALFYTDEYMLVRANTLRKKNKPHYKLVEKEIRNYFGVVVLNGKKYLTKQCSSFEEALKEREILLKLLTTC